MELVTLRYSQTGQHDESPFMGGELYRLVGSRVINPRERRQSYFLVFDRSPYARYKPSESPKILPKIIISSSDIWGVWKTTEEIVTKKPTPNDPIPHKAMTQNGMKTASVRFFCSLLVVFFIITMNYTRVIYCRV